MNLKKIRMIKKMTQSELAKSSGVAQGFISSIERGQKQPTLTIIQKLADGLSITVPELLGYDDNCKIG